MQYTGNITELRKVAEQAGMKKLPPADFTAEQLHAARYEYPQFWFFWFVYRKHKHPLRSSGAHNDAWGIGQHDDETARIYVDAYERNV